MMRPRLGRYIGLVFMVVVVAPAIFLGLLAIRSIGREEVYIESQLERTLSAEVDHVSTLIRTEVDGVERDLTATASRSFGPDPGDSLESWKLRSALVDIPFLLSPAYEILWPTAEDQARSDAKTLIGQQQAFLEDEARVPVYENVAVVHRDEIVGAARSEAPTADVVAAPGADKGLVEAEEPPERAAPAEAAPAVTQSLAKSRSDKDARAGLTAQETEQTGYSDQSKTQEALSEFMQSEPVREKVYQKAEAEGQKISYRNVEPAAEADNLARKPSASREGGQASGGTEAQPALDAERVATDKAAKVRARQPSRAAPPTVDRATREQADRLRSIFVSQPLRLSEIVARGTSGIVPLPTEGGLRLLYWRKLPGGNIVGCLVGPQTFRERLIGVLPGVYSPSRILTVLDERGLPLVTPTGQPDRDWRRPFVAQEISEVLPGWEVAAYLTDPDVISSRARTATLVMWILVFMMIVSIVVGGVLVVQSASSEVKLARQKTTFVANVSHELKTPLTSIRMFAEMLRDGRQPDEAKRLQYLDIMKGEAERLTRLVNNVLDFSRMEQGKKRYTMKPFDLAGLTAGVVESQRASLEHGGFTVTFQAADRPLLVHADDEAIKQTLVNLISNAEKYSGQVKEIEVSMRREGGRAVARVSDRGIGIPAGDAEKIFAEFYRVDDALTSRVKGTGLGLTIARRIARDHGGDITYVAREGGGSIFDLALPLIEE